MEEARSLALSLGQAGAAVAVQRDADSARPGSQNRPREPVPVYTFTMIRMFFQMSKGLIRACPFDHNAFLAQMQALTAGPRIGPDPNVVPLQIPLVDSKFCRDGFNVHGPRDSFREMVKQGPGLHICITQPAARAITPCDLHIDQIQQGQVCSGSGVCIPLINGQTIEHLKTVAPWLAEEAKRKLGL